MAKGRGKGRVPPQRTCAGCRTVRAQRELVRVVRTPTGEVELDDGRGKRPGRGVYVCPDENCLQRALRTKALERALKVSIPDDVVAALGERVAALASAQAAGGSEEANGAGHSPQDGEG